jgi:hypothetical protein
MKYNIKQLNHDIITIPPYSNNSITNMIELYPYQHNELLKVINSSSQANCDIDARFLNSASENILPNEITIEI